jgi:hypothetical protein
MKEENENNEISNSLKEFIQKIAEMRAVQFMVENAPKDNKGNVVVSIVGIHNFGMFYLFEN